MRMTKKRLLIIQYRMEKRKVVNKSKYWHDMSSVTLDVSTCEEWDCKHESGTSEVISGQQRP